IYVFSLKSGMNMAFHEYDDTIIIDKIYFIAYDAGERLLIISHNQFDDEPTTHLMDPFSLRIRVPATKLFETDVEIQDPYIIKFDNVIGIINQEVAIYSGLVRKDWIKYLREELGDYNRIFVLSDSKFITEMINEELADKINKNFTKTLFTTEKDIRHYDGSYLKWNLYFTPNDKPKSVPKIELEALFYDKDKAKWIPVEGEFKRIINPNFPPPEHTRKLKIIRCECLKNDDLLMLTTLGILIWTVYQQKGIRLHYYWGRGKIRNEKSFNLEKTFLEKTFLNLESYTNTFPDSKFQIIIKNKTLKFGSVGEGPKSFFFRELLEDYISDKFFIINYGSILMETFLFLKEDEWIEKLCKECYNLIFSTDGLKSTSDIQLLSIIVKVLPQLLKRHPIYLAKFLSQTAFTLPVTDHEMMLDSDIIKISSTPHLHHFGTYNNLTKNPLFDDFMSKMSKSYWNKLFGEEFEEFIDGSDETRSDEYDDTRSGAEAKIKFIIPLPNI
ncbi:24381_t:CDS:2, partial [Racocetra persica]